MDKTLIVCLFLACMLVGFGIFCVVRDNQNNRDYTLHMAQIGLCRTAPDTDLWQKCK